MGPRFVDDLGHLCFIGGDQDECASQAECRERTTFDLQKELRRMKELGASLQGLGAGAGAGVSADASEATVPVLYVTQMALYTWQQHAPGGCRCVCGLYHEGQGVCLEPAEPGHFLRVVAPANPVMPGDISELLQICAACYAAIAPRAGTPPATS